ncbi:hypothetical protein [Scytonema sp. HK-05]|uniref:hypothetical protein n=1 Tax=Scytonema sp. HK-05 TaxID=1137095 RepID=UPI0013013766|nr:hypothetical protein [Scytonema sp. HK-05]
MRRVRFPKSPADGGDGTSEVPAQGGMGDGQSPADGGDGTSARPRGDRGEE